MSVDFAVVLARPQGPVNVGMVCRSCANFGVEDLRMVAPHVALDDLDCRRYAMGAKALLQDAPSTMSVAEAVADRDLVIGTSANPRLRGTMPMLSVEELPAWIAARGSARTAIVFGNEADGMTNQELEACQAVVHIPTPGSYPSLNLSHAVTVVLHVLTRQPIAAAPDGELPSADEMQGLLQEWLLTLDRFGYFQRMQRERYGPALKRMLDRLRPNAHDVSTLRGMLGYLRGRAPSHE